MLVERPSSQLCSTAFEVSEIHHRNFTKLLTNLALLTWIGSLGGVFCHHSAPNQMVSFSVNSPLVHGLFLPLIWFVFGLSTFATPMISYTVPSVNNGTLPLPIPMIYTIKLDRFSLLILLETPSHYHQLPSRWMLFPLMMAGRFVLLMFVLLSPNPSTVTSVHLLLLLSLTP